MRKAVSPSVDPHDPRRTACSFTWDPDKAVENFRKHGVTFLQGASAFLDPHGLDGVDKRDPSREKFIARSAEHRLLTVHIEVKGAVIRIISACRATRAERGGYERGPRDGGQVETNGYRWRRNPYAAALDQSGIVVLGEALPRNARTFAGWKNRRSAVVRLCRAFVAYEMARGDAGKPTDFRLERAVADVAGCCIGCWAMRRLPEDADAKRPARRMGAAKALAVVGELLSELTRARKPATRRASGRTPTTGTRNR